MSAAAKGQLWWQFYPRQDLDASRELLERAQTVGYTAIVVTVDQQASFYERSQQDRNLGGSPRNAAGRGGRAGGPVDPEAAGAALAGRGAGGARGGGAAAAAGGRGGRGSGPVTGPALYRLGAGRLWYTWQDLDEIRNEDLTWVDKLDETKG